MIYDVTVRTGLHDFDMFEVEAKSFSEAYILAGKVARSPIVLRIKEKNEGKA